MGAARVSFTLFRRRDSALTEPTAPCSNQHSAGDMAPFPRLMLVSSDAAECIRTNPAFHRSAAMHRLQQVKGST